MAHVVHMPNIAKSKIDLSVKESWVSIQKHGHRSKLIKNSRRTTLSSPSPLEQLYDSSS